MLSQKEWIRIKEKESSRQIVRLKKKRKRFKLIIFLKFGMFRQIVLFELRNKNKVVRDSSRAYQTSSLYSCQHLRLNKKKKKKNR